MTINEALMPNISHVAISLFAFILFAPSLEAQVNITSTLSSLTVEHGAEEVVIERVQDTENLIDFNYQFTSRPCPPFCVQPMQLAPGVETIGELELLDYLRRREESGAAVLLIDSRTSDWAERGMIPGAINIPWTELYPGRASAEQIAEHLEFSFGARFSEGLWHFSSARTLILYCNGMWCGQSPTNIRALLEIGYPAQKLKWYRGGMQAWETLGLTTIAADTDSSFDDDF